MPANQPIITNEARAVVPNAKGKWMADLLRSTQEGLNNVTVSGHIPFTDIGGKIGIGELLMGEGPRLADDMAHGDFGIKRTGHGYNLDPAYMDLAGVGAMAVAPAATAGKTMLKKGSKEMSAALRRSAEAPDTPPDPSRRKVLGKAAAVTAAAAFPTMAIKALKEGAVPAVKSAAKTTATVAAKGLSSKALHAGATKMMADIMRRSDAVKGSLKHLSDDELVGALPERFKKVTDKFEELDAKFGDDFNVKRYMEIQLDADKVPGNWAIKNEKVHDMKYRKFMDMWDNPDNTKFLDALEQFEATGKWPKGTKDLQEVYHPYFHDEVKFHGGSATRDPTGGLDLHDEVYELIEAGAGGPQ